MAGSMIPSREGTDAKVANGLEIIGNLTGKISESAEYLLSKIAKLEKTLIGELPCNPSPGEVSKNSALCGGFIGAEIAALEGILKTFEEAHQSLNRTMNHVA